jgi:hypothetical protein
MTDCDWRMLGLDQLPTSSATDWGIDSDQDGMPDFIEIIKGTNPAVADMTADPDVDGVDTRKEIALGRDPFANDQAIPDYQLNQYHVEFNKAVDSECPYGRWDLSLDRVQVARTMEFVADSSFSAMSHQKDEQVVYIYYRKIPLNSQNPLVEYYGRFVNLNLLTQKQLEVITASVNQLNPRDFFYLGSVPK